MRIGTYLRKRRDELGWSQEAVMLAIGMDRGQATYSNWENGKALPSIPQLFKLAEALKTTPEMLLTGKPASAVHVEHNNHTQSNNHSKNGVFYENSETEHWRTIAEERGERCNVEKKLIEKLEQENEALRKQIEALEAKNGK